MRVLLLFVWASMSLLAQSFYVLLGVNSYDAIVENMSKKTAKYTEDIKSLMQSMSKEIGVSTQGHPSRVLYFLAGKGSGNNYNSIPSQ